MGLRKGDQTFFLDGGEAFDAIVIEVLTPTRAITRVMEGLMAGDEVVADFPDGALEFPWLH
jgi:hypothetical protein